MGSIYFEQDHREIESSLFRKFGRYTSSNDDNGASKLYISRSRTKVVQLSDECGSIRPTRTVKRIMIRIPRENMDNVQLNTPQFHLRPGEGAEFKNN